MLENSETKNPTAIENYVCKEIEKCKRVPMDEETSKLLITLMIARAKSKGTERKIPDMEKPFIVQMIEKRLSLYSFTMDFDMILFLAVICETPGKAVLYLWYLQYWAKKHDIKELNLDILCERIFPMGFPTDETMHKIWDGQKIKREEGGMSDNLVDYSEAGMSLHI